MTLESHLTELVEKHRVLDRRIEEEATRPTSDDLLIAELKRRKLHLKDEIHRLQSEHVSA